MERKNVVVIGSGAVGLTSAVLIQERFPQLKVTVLTKSESPNTVSDVAAGIFRWGLKSPPGKPNNWALDSWNWYQQLLKKNEPDVTGVSKLPAFFFSAHDASQCENDLMKSLCKVYRKCTQRELNLPQPEGRFKHGVYMHTVQIDTEIYLAYLADRFRKAGGIIKQCEVKSFKDVQADVIVNCAGFGARFLAGDRELLPLRGQVIRVKAPWIKTALYADDTYVIPGQKHVTVGGTRQYNDWMTDVEPNDTARIWSRAVQTFPCLAEAEILGERVGLRPHRKYPRVEVEEIYGRTVVHNYGHCGYGIMASPGTSIQAADLVRDILANTQSKL